MRKKDSYEVKRKTIVDTDGQVHHMFIVRIGKIVSASRTEVEALQNIREHHPVRDRN